MVYDRLFVATLLRDRSSHTEKVLWIYLLMEKRSEQLEVISRTDDLLQKMQGFYTILGGCFQAGLHELCSLV